MKTYQKILIVRTDRIGDVVLTTPAIESLRKNFPGAHITLMVSKSTRDLVLTNPFINEVIIDDRAGMHRGVWGFWRLVLELQAKHFDLAVIFHTKKRTNALCFLAGIAERIGYQDKNFGFLLTNGLSDCRAAGEKHESEYCLDVLRAIGCVIEDPAMHVCVSPSAESWADEWFRVNINPALPLVAIHPGASDTTKCWPVSSFAQLIERLNADGCQVVIIGSKEIKELAREIRRQCPVRFFDLTGETSLSQLVSLLKRCRLLISNDSGPVHVAAAVGTPVISLFLRLQPGINPERWKPLGPKSFILTNPIDDAVVLDRFGTIVSGSKSSISVQKVFDLITKIIANP